MEQSSSSNNNDLAGKIVGILKERLHDYFDYAGHAIPSLSNDKDTKQKREFLAAYQQAFGCDFNKSHPFIYVSNESMLARALRHTDEVDPDRASIGKQGLMRILEYVTSISRASDNNNALDLQQIYQLTIRLYFTAGDNTRHAILRSLVNSSSYGRYREIKGFFVAGLSSDALQQRVTEKIYSIGYVEDNRIPPKECGITAAYFSDASLVLYMTIATLRQRNLIADNHKASEFFAAHFDRRNLGYYTGRMTDLFHFLPPTMEFFDQSCSNKDLDEINKCFSLFYRLLFRWYTLYPEQSQALVQTIANKITSKNAASAEALFEVYEATFNTNVNKNTECQYQTLVSELTAFLDGKVDQKQFFIGTPANQQQVSASALGASISRMLGSGLAAISSSHQNDDTAEKLYNML